jgi:hypothetical protein
VGDTDAPEGAVFQFRLPVDGEETSPSQRKRDPPPRCCMSEEQPVVFVVDDDPSVREALASLLRSVGLEVQSFGATQ